MSPPHPAVCQPPSAPVCSPSLAASCPKPQVQSCVCNRPGWRLGNRESFLDLTSSTVNVGMSLPVQNLPRPLCPLLLFLSPSPLWKPRFNPTLLEVPSLPKPLSSDRDNPQIPGPRYTGPCPSLVMTFSLWTRSGGGWGGRSCPFVAKKGLCGFFQRAATFTFLSSNIFCFHRG